MAVFAHILNYIITKLKKIIFVATVLHYHPALLHCKNNTHAQHCTVSSSVLKIKSLKSTHTQTHRLSNSLKEEGGSTGHMRCHRVRDMWQHT